MWYITVVMSTTDIDRSLRSFVITTVFYVFSFNKCGGHMSYALASNFFPQEQLSLSPFRNELQCSVLHAQALE